MFILGQTQLEVIFLVFCRLFGLIFFLPGSNLLPIRVLVLLAFMCAVMVGSIVEFEVVNFNLQLLMETAVGCVMGLMVAVMFSAVNLASTIIVFQSGLMYSALSSVSDEMGSSLVKFINLIVVILLLHANMYPLILLVLIDSYQYLKFDDFLLSADLPFSLLQIAGDSLLLAFKIASPIMVLGTVMYFCSGLVNRLIPSIQAFFIFSPMQIWINLLVLSFAISEIAVYLTNSIMDQISNLRLYAS